MSTITIGLLILAIYLGIVIVKEQKCPPSISDTFYECGKWWFTLVMFTESILLSIALLDMTPTHLQSVAFFAGAGLAFVGAAPHFKEDFEEYVHYSGALCFGVCSQLWCALNVSPYILLTWLVGILWMVAFKSKATFIAEINCVVNIAIGVYVI